MYLTMAEYTERTGSFPGVEVFNRFNARAVSEIDMRTFGRLEKWEFVPLSTQEKVKSAIAEMILQMENEPAAEERRIKSESVGPHSVTYEYAENPKEAKSFKEIITRHLINTGLLYRGFDVW